MNHLFGNTAYTPAAMWYYLSQSDPGDTGANLIEPPTAAGYARLAETSAPLGAASTIGNVNQASNSAIATFASASGNWGRIRYCGLASSATVNDQASILTYGPVDSPSSISTANQPAVLPLGAFVLSLD
jgi:hypothetical protein